MITDGRQLHHDEATGSSLSLSSSSSASMACVHARGRARMGDGLVGRRQLQWEVPVFMGACLGKRIMVLQTHLDGRLGLGHDVRLGVVGRGAAGVVVAAAAQAALLRIVSCCCYLR